MNRHPALLCLRARGQNQAKRDPRSWRNSGPTSTTLFDGIETSGTLTQGT
ncbi:hypothetical protein PISMIDRAFT_674924 [Pisolithus microcarpus 441]|uniref:Uncharacterized protein n=1 Tax=Pisolithus microcarpus 441 TaxID=765257 RepID=A0A0C9ZZB5_9AGAM|nr:hypothetical protein PISMIDRAFT_674924 [Pisolithus microcarpus 441]